MTRRLAALVFSLWLVAAIPAAHAGVTVAVAGNTATAGIALPNGVEAELILTFDQATNLSASALGISARAIELSDPTLLARLPAGGLATVPAALPLLITVEPPMLGGLQLANSVRVELHTHALPYAAGSSFRLFKAPLHGAFRDITDEVAPGSVRTRGTTGGFSQFLVLLDLRPTGAVVEEKLAALQARVADLPDSQRDALEAQLDGVAAAVEARDFAGAIALLDAFRANISAQAGGAIPNQWTPAQRSGNVAGDLLGGAASLRFSVGYLRDYGG